MSAIVRFGARLVAGLAAVAVIAGPVVVVALIVGNPIPGDILDRLGSRRVDDATILKVLSLGFYACWAWFCLPALREIGRAITRPPSTVASSGPDGRAGARSRRVAAEPLADSPRGMLARLARFAVSGAALVTTATAPAATLAVISAPAAIVATSVVAPPAARSADAAPAASARVEATRTHVAQHRDTPYAVASRFAAPGGVDEMRARIVDLNLGRPLPGGAAYRGGAFPAGFEVLVPAATGPNRGGAEPVDVSTAIVDAPAPYAATEVVIVEVGDNLWDLSEAHLEAAGLPHDDGAVLGHVEGVIAANPDVVEDPNLIFEGEQFVLPAVGSPPPPVADVPVPIAPDAPTPATPVPPPVVTPPATVPSPPPAPAPASAPTTTLPAAVPSPPPATPTPMGAEASVPGSPSPIGIGEATLLSAGVLALLGARRRQRLRSSLPRARVPEPSAGHVAAERRLRTVDAGERLLRLDVAVRAAAATLVEGDSQIAVVRVGGDGLVELVLTADADLRAPWEGAASRWELPGSAPVELLAEAARSVGAPCVALTQLGVDADGREVLVDLEALGVLSIAAPPALADAVVRGVAATLATSIFAEVANLVGVGIDESVFLDHRQAHAVATVDGALELAATLVGSTAAARQSTFVLRSRHTSGEAWEPAVVLVGSSVADEVTADLVRSAARRRGGLAVVAAGDAPGAPWSLRAGAGGWTLEPLGISLVPVGLTSRDVEELHDVLRQADAPLVRDEDTVADGPDVGPLGNGSAPAPDEPFVEAPWSLLVRVLGPVEVTAATGAAATFERSKALELIAWLTLHRDRSTRVGARTALWELDVRDATFANVVSEARRSMARLVEPPAGEEWLGRTLTDVLPLHGGVVSDVDLLRARLDHARLQPPELAIRTLHPAVDLIRDMPFAGTGYLWPDAEGITSNLVLLATSAATELAGHHLSMGD
ncbi:MAG: hypothetical protein ABW328_15160, partial [Ilumatobacteraceae bacterium]